MRIYPQWFIDELVCENDKQRALSGELTSNDVVELTCSKHGTYKLPVHKRIRVSTMEKNRECPLCGRENRSLHGVETRRSVQYPQWFIDGLVNDVDKQKAISGELSCDNKTFVDYKCEYCGSVSSRSVGNIIEITTGTLKHYCNNCSKHRAMVKKRESWAYNGLRSAVEVDMDEWLVSKGFSTTHETSVLGGIYDIDILIGNKGIEVDGFGHYECIDDAEYYDRIQSGQIVKKPGYHKMKDDLAAAQGITLLHVTDDEWRNDNENTKMKILSFLRNI